MPKVTRIERPTRSTYTPKTTSKPTRGPQMFRWWNEKDPVKRSQQLISTVVFLKTNQQFRQRQAALFARLYGNHSLYSFIGSNMGKLDQQAGLPPDRPTFNLVSSVIDTLVSKLTQNRPAPVFLTDNSDYKERSLAKKLNNFILGEFYQAEAYEKGEYILIDALDQGTGCMLTYETPDHKVGLERVLLTELFIDLAEGMYGYPRALYRVKLYDRMVLESMFDEHRTQIDDAEGGLPDNSSSSNKSVSDLVMVVEGWHLRSGEKATDGCHAIACSEGELFCDPKWNKRRFPVTFLHHRKRLAGFWSQGVAETLMGTQLELNGVLSTISQSLKLCGVPRWLVESGSKINSAAFCNLIGVEMQYTGKEPIFHTANSNAEDLYQERDRLIQYGYRQEGLSEMAAASQKPAGLDSGEAIRTYDNINTDRFAALSRRYDNFYVDLAYQIVDMAKDIAEREGKYQTIYPDKHGTKEIDLPKLTLLKDPFVIQCFNESSLPRDPAGRIQAITERVQAGILTIREGRRLMDYPDTQQIETLANASEERIFNYLDQIVEMGKYNPPDPFMDLILAEELVTQYYNLYETRKLERDRCDKLRLFFTQIQTLKQAAMPAPAPSGPTPQAVPAPPAVSPLLPNAPGAQAQAA